MTDLLTDEDYWTGSTILDESADVATPNDERPAFDGHDDDAYGWAEQ